MRVLMTADTVGGVWTYALELVDALAPHGVHVELALMGRAMSDAQRDALRHSHVAAVHESTYALEWMPDPWHDVDRAGRWLLQLEETVQPDIVHLNGFAHASLRWSAPVLVVAHSCVCSWWSAVHGADPPAAWDTYRRRVGDGLAAATAIAAPTGWMLAELQRWYGAPPGRVVPNARRRDWLDGACEKEPLILAAGRVWDEGKNLALLEQVAPRVPWDVIIAGDTPGAPSAHEGGSPRFTGELPFPELAALLQRASIFVAPARYEPFGLAALEAAHAGCALVLGNIPTLREVWRDAVLYVDPDDPDALAHTITALTRDPRDLHAWGERARTAAATYVPERMAAGYLELYRSLERRPALA